MKLKLAVIGDPVAHSLSPQLFAGFFAAHGVEGTYEAIQVPAGGAARAIAELMAAGYTGLNVTTPLKEEAYAAAAVHDPAAQFVRAANMLTLRNGHIEAGNSDGRGGVRALEAALGTPLADRAVLVLGTGPTGRAVAHSASLAGARVRLWNRTPAKAQTLCTRLASARKWIEGDAIAAAFSTLPPDAELSEGVLAALRDAPIVIDANYGPRSTLGARLGRDVIDGYTMLAAQAEIAFALWR